MRKRSLVFLSLFSLPCFFPSPLCSAEEKKEFLTIEEIAKTKANQLFITRRFAEALEEFRKLEREYPKDIVVKRYQGACLDHLKRDEEAIGAFKEVLKLNPNDLPSRQFLAKIYLRNGKLDKAEEEFTFIVANDARGTFAPRARAQLEVIKQLRQAETKALGAPGREIGSEKFLETKAAKAFMNAKYEEALEELKALEAKFPPDLLIKRYQGIALDKLGRFDEAVLVYQAALALAAENIPIHYYLAQTLLHKKDYDGAKREYRYVVTHDESRVYQGRAKAELDALEKALKQAKPKKWSFNASGGVEWDSNPTSKSKFRYIAPARGVSAWKFSNSAGGSYEVFRKGAWSGKATYSYSGSFYSNAVDSLNTISNGVGATLSYVRKVKGRPLLVQFGHTTTHALVEQEYYSTSFAQSLAAIYSLTDWYRITLSERWTVSKYHREGSAPDQTSRDGFGNVLGLTNNFYLNKKKSISFLWGADYGRDDTQGKNNIKNYGAYRTGFHFPFFFKSEMDLSFKFKDSYFPKWGLPNSTPARRDEEYTLGANLSRQLSTHWTLNANYNYTNADSRAGDYTYRNHALGFSLSYNY